MTCSARIRTGASTMGAVDRDGAAVPRGGEDAHRPGDLVAEGAKPARAGAIWAGWIRSLPPKPRRAA